MLPALSLAIALLLLSAGSASALTFSFDCIKGKSKKCQEGESQLSVEVLDGAAPGQVAFTFRNLGAAKLDAIGLFVDDDSGALDSLSSVFNSEGTNFDPGGKPLRLQGGKKVDFSADFRATAQNPRGESSLKPGSEVTMNFALATGQTLADVLAALEAGGMRIGVRAVKSFVNVPESSVVPEPGSLALLAAIAAGATAQALRSRKS